MLTRTAQEAIALLMDLAQQGEINPWDVQVIEIIDRFLEELGLDAVNPDVSSLSQSGQAFVWASRLVWLKAETLQEDRVTSEAIETPAEPIDEESSTERIKLEQHLKRRTSVGPSLKKRKVTLGELVQQLQAISWEIEKSTSSQKPNIRNPRPHSRREAVRLVTELAHQENLLETASLLEEFLKKNQATLKVDQEWLSLEDLLESYHNQSDRVGVFWALLLLSSQSKVELNQSEFYGDLQLRLI